MKSRNGIINEFSMQEIVKNAIARGIVSEDVKRADVVEQKVKSKKRVGFGRRN